MEYKLPLLPTDRSVENSVKQQTQNQSYYIASGKLYFGDVTVVAIYRCDGANHVVVVVGKNATYLGSGLS